MIAPKDLKIDLMGECYEVGSASCRSVSSCHGSPSIVVRSGTASVVRSQAGRQARQASRQAGCVRPLLQQPVPISRKRGCFVVSGAKIIIISRGLFPIPTYVYVTKVDSPSRPKDDPCQLVRTHMTRNTDP